eukprot:TRINITY_DN1551_c6_g1_i1.p1 TRINITY_DN1551_c6_g1~~TRINITY_DN1551_c6_g1_i1.p1  ORF type:complete len:429 (+),score=185.77 TRINITY_DN1551_c6_g1_i1:641-1927(+)
MRDRDVQDTIWADVQGMDLSADDQKALEEMFARKAPAKREEEGGGGQKKPDVIGGKRENMLQVMLKFLRASPEDIILSALRVDTAIFAADSEGADALKSLARMGPTEEEQAAVAALTPAQLAQQSPAVRYIAITMKIDRFSLRLGAWGTMLEFESVEVRCYERIKYLMDGSVEVRQNKQFIDVLHTILRLGNFLNLGSGQADAKGVRVPDLLKLKELRATDGKSTLLDWIVTYLTRTSPDLVEFHCDLRETVQRAASVDLLVLQQELRELGRSIDVCGREAKTAPITGWQAEDRFPETIGAFHRKAKPRFDKLNGEYDAMLASQRETMKMFGESPQANVADWYKALHQFLTQYAQALDQRDFAQKKKREAEARARAPQQRPSSAVAPAVSSGGRPPPPRARQPPSVASPPPAQTPQQDAAKQELLDLL